MAIKNKKIFPEVNQKLINPEFAENKIWIETQVSKGKTWDLNRIYSTETSKEKSKPKKNKPVNKKTELKNSNKIEPEAENDPIIIDPHRKKLRELSYKKDLEALKKTQYENQIKLIEINKKQGNLIPVDAVKSVFIFAIETIRTTYIQELDSLASKFSVRWGANDALYKELQKDLNDAVNDIMKEAKKSLKDGVSSVIEEYQEVRGRGEKK